MLGSVFRTCVNMCYVAIYLCISKEKVRLLEEVRSTRCRVMAMLLGFEEK